MDLPPFQPRIVMSKKMAREFAALGMLTPSKMPSLSYASMLIVTDGQQPSEFYHWPVIPEDAPCDR